MRFTPAGDPGVPDSRSATRYLIWVASRHRRLFGIGVAFGVVWMVAQALMPAAVGRAVDGLARRDEGSLLTWGLVLFGLGVLQAVAGILRHRCAVHNFLAAAYRTVQLTVSTANRLGAALPRRVAAGEVVSIGTADIGQVGNAVEITARGVGALVAIATVAVILLTASMPLGLVVVLGVPLLMAVVGLLIRPLHRQQQAYRDAEGALTTRAGDLVSGLRVLRGVGGEPVLSARYRTGSQELRAHGLRVARVESLLEAAQVLLPGAFLVLVTWLGARFALRGEISAGQLVAFYGYTAFLVSPLRNLTEAVDKMTRGHVAARRVVRLLRLTPDLVDPAQPRVLPDGPGALVDPESGVALQPGLLTVLAASAPEDAAAIVDRLGRYTDSDATLHGVPLRALALATVRARILVADNDAHLFTGLLRAELDPHDRATRPRSRRPWWRRARRTSSTPCPTGWTARSPSAAGSSPAGSDSGCGWPAHWSPTRRRCCWSSRPAPSTHTPRPGSRSGWVTPGPAGPPWSAPPARWCSAGPTG
ncbi:hypothetical protein GCM10027614_58650 [Micromonospora vulcania]